MASRSVTCYPTEGKLKAQMICAAFAEGCGGSVADTHTLLPGDAFFYGVVGRNIEIFNQALREGRDWYYCDNAYFDRGREAYYRITRNAFQVSQRMQPDNGRFRALGIKLHEWKRSGSHIVVCDTGEQFLRLSGYAGNWLSNTLTELRKHTDRPIKVRPWSRNKGKLAATLRADLEGAHALVTHMSAAANEAVLFGVPVFVTGQCAATPMSGASLSEIERPVYPPNVHDWAAGLAANQWTINEIRNGITWRKLNDS